MFGLIACGTEGSPSKKSEVGSIALGLSLSGSLIVETQYYVQYTQVQIFEKSENDETLLDTWAVDIREADAQKYCSKNVVVRIAYLDNRTSRPSNATYVPCATVTDSWDKEIDYAMLLDGKQVTASVELDGISVCLVRDCHKHSFPEEVTNWTTKYRQLFVNWNSLTEFVPQKYRMYILGENQNGSFDVVGLDAVDSPVLYPTNISGESGYISDTPVVEYWYDSTRAFFSLQSTTNAFGSSSITKPAFTLGSVDFASGDVSRAEGWGFLLDSSWAPGWITVSATSITEYSFWVDFDGSVYPMQGSDFCIVLGIFDRNDLSVHCLEDAYFGSISSFQRDPYLGNDRPVLHVRQKLYYTGARDSEHVELLYPNPYFDNLHYYSDLRKHIQESDDVVYQNWYEGASVEVSVGSQKTGAGLIGGFDFKLSTVNRLYKIFVETGWSADGLFVDSYLDSENDEVIFLLVASRRSIQFRIPVNP